MNPTSPVTLYPVLPLRDIVVFPHMIVPLFVGREKSVRALEEVMKNDKQILLVTQRDAGKDDPGPDDLFKVGAVGTVLQLLKLPDGTVKVLVEGGARARIERFARTEEYFEALALQLAEPEADASEIEALARSVTAHFENYVKLNKKVPPEVLVSLNQIEDPGRLVDTAASHLAIKISEKQELLEIESVKERLERIYSMIEGEIGVMQVEKKIRSRVKRQMEKTQREYYLNEQLKAIQKELGEGEESKDELAELERKIAETKLSKEARERAIGELKKLRNMSPMSAEATVVRNYLDWILQIPWRKRTRVKKDLALAQRVLDEDHYGLEKVKDRIVEYLAVQVRTNKVRGPILCLVGPPGVGKTSLGKSIARATGRNFVRISLGGVRDEAEIRGHRRTYIGSLPGKIVQGMKKGKSSNPLFLLDEVDKMGADFRGDPASALLEVLDPEQNVAFNDHYLEIDYDLSEVMFITTANTRRIPPALLDRMEVIRIGGYTEDEKVEIARRHLIPKQVKRHGLKKDEWSISDDALRAAIRLYTREAGVRNLEREIANLTRKAVKEILLAAGKGGKAEKGAKAEKDAKARRAARTLRVTRRNLQKYAGVPRYRHDESEQEDLVGVVTGLAYTDFGGALLSIESVVMPGKGRNTITGQLGGVMRESVQAAVSYVRSRATGFGIEPPMFERRDIHIHVPEGATPKDGPSAGIAMTCSIVSALTGIPVDSTVAMTGEVTLRGRVLPVGGLKEKLLAALRAEVKTVLIPKDNEKDLAEIPDNVKKGLAIVPAATVDEVIEHALKRRPTPIEWDEAAAKAPPPAGKDAKAGEGAEPVVTH